MPPFTRLLALIGTFALNVAAQPVFQGYVVSDGEALLSISDASQGDTTPRWLKVGNGVAEYRIAAFDVASETVTLIDKAGKRIKLKVRQSVLVESHTTLAGTVRISNNENANPIKVILRFNEVNEIPIGKDVWLLLTPKVRADGNIQYQAIFETRNSAGSSVQQGPRVIARPGQRFAVSAGDTRFDFTPSDNRR